MTSADARHSAPSAGCPRVLPPPASGRVLVALGLCVAASPIVGLLCAWALTVELRDRLERRRRELADRWDEILDGP